MYISGGYILKIIGLCGGSGSGKGTVAELFSVYGIMSVDTDAVYHELTSHKSPCLDEIVNTFGKDILNGDGSLNRKELAKIVFNGEDSMIKRSMLNRISHKHVLNKTKEIISECEKNGAEIVAIDAPLLFESGFNKECEFIVSVTADIDVRIDRIMARDRIDKNAATLRIKSQLPDSYLIENSDYHLVNNGSFEDLEKQMSDLILKLKTI